MPIKKAREAIRLARDAGMGPAGIAWHATKSVGGSVKDGVSKVGAGTVAAGAAVGGAVAGGAAATMGVAKDIHGRLKSGANAVAGSDAYGWFIILFGLVMIFYDWSFKFIRGWEFDFFFLGYLILSIVGYLRLRTFGYDVRESFVFSLRMFAFSYFLPFIVFWLSQTQFSNILTDVTLFAALTFGFYLPLYLMYFFGWGKYVLDEISAKFKPLAWLSGFVFIVVILSILLPVASTVVLGSSLGSMTSGPLQVESPKQAVVDTHEGTKEYVSQFVSGTQDTAEAIFNSTTRTYYTGRVEQQQGLPLGVFIRDQQSIQPFYRLGVEQGTDDDPIRYVEGIDQYVTWFGTVRARTFADELDVRLSCLYQYEQRNPDDSSDMTEVNVTEPAVPGELFISYTGQFQDEFYFDCQMPIDEGSELLAAANEDRGLMGRFYTVADYTFDTWGYVTYTFMDRTEFLALRREGIEPANHLGIQRNPVALYTPGPVTLGLERQQQPIPITIDDPDRNQALRFGVTIDDAWAQGDIKNIHSLVLQVPEEFELDIDKCAGVRGDYGGILGPGEFVNSGVSDAEVPAGYQGYVWTNLQLNDDVRFITVSCPMNLASGDYSDLLQLDLSPRQFTFIAQVNYDYQSESPVSVRISGERI